jgi:hypothetical protein
MEDMLDQTNEIQEALGRQYGCPDDIDEADLEAELDALGDELALDDDTQYLDEIGAPSIPSKEPGADSTAVREYLRPVTYDCGYSSKRRGSSLNILGAKRRRSTSGHFLGVGQTT